MTATTPTIVDSQQLIQSAPASTEYAALPAIVRAVVHDRLAAMREIESAPNPYRGALAVAARLGRAGFSAPRLRILYARWVGCGRDWRVLIDRTKAGAQYRMATCPQIALPAEFIEHWRGLCQRNQRGKARAAHRVLVSGWRRWVAGDAAAAIPGYAAPPAPDAGTDLPAGWTLRNLYRHRPTRYEALAARIGRAAAAAERPLVLTTRAGLEPGEYYMFDDFWHDLKVVVAGQRHASRLLQFHALDLASACSIARGYKPIVERDAAGQVERLREREMLYLLAFVLGNLGYRPGGTRLVVEHGTAAVRPQVEARLHELTRGAVTVERSGIEGRPAWAGMYGGRPKGNYRFKAALESLGNLIHNDSADILLLPGATGANSRMSAPEELHGRDRHADALLRAVAALPPERAAQLRMPFLDHHQAIFLLEDIQERINRRTDHALEGWAEAGHLAHEFRLAPDQPWLSADRLAALDPQRRAAVDAVITGSEDLLRVRPLSPREVWDRGRARLVRLPEHAAALLLYSAELPEAAVRSHLLEFEDGEMSPAPMRYLARTRPDPHGPEQYLPDGERYALAVNPLAPERAHVFDARGRYLGSASRWQGVCRGDTDALHRAMGRAAQVEADLLRPVAARGAEITRRRIADARHNAGVLDPGVTWPAGAPAATVAELDDLPCEPAPDPAAGAADEWSSALAELENL